MSRVVIAQMWTGPRVVARLPFYPEDVDLMDDAELRAQARALVEQFRPWRGISSWRTVEARARLREWPTAEDLDRIAGNLTADNRGVKPRVRVLASPSRPTSRVA